MIRCTEILVRGYHTDLYGHVNNARFLEFLEEARWALLEERVDYRALHEQGVGFSVVNININYRAPALPGTVLELFARIDEVGKKSAVMFQEIRKKGTTEVVADAQVTFCLWNLKTGKALPIEGEFLALVGRMNE